MKLYSHKKILKLKIYLVYLLYHPILQKNRPTGQDSLKASGFDARFQLTRLNIKVLVDTSYSDEDVDFVEEAVILIANADEFRGDIISVSKKVFPEINRAIAQDIKKSTARSITTQIALLDRNNRQKKKILKKSKKRIMKEKKVIENSMFRQLRQIQ